MENSTRSGFRVNSEYQPTGDQPRAIEQLTSGLDEGLKAQTLLGVTGSGKTHTMARVIEQAGRPALVIAHNKTLAAQLASEFLHDVVGGVGPGQRHVVGQRHVADAHPRELPQGGE